LIIFSFSGCETDDAITKCKEFNFTGKWDVTAQKIEKNFTLQKIDTSFASFYLTFNNSHLGYFNSDSLNNFIWGTQCEPYILLISEPLNSNDTSDLKLYDATNYIILDASKSEKIILSYTRDHIQSADYIRTQIYWTLSK